MTKAIGIFLGAFMTVICIAVYMSMCNNAGKTIVQEFSPGVLLKKYEYFKDLSAGIDRKHADIEMYQEEIKELVKNNDNSKEDKFYLQQRKSELIGIISIHNGLCEEYNSAMSKFNYRFTNAGDLPATNLTPLPREIKPYINSTK